MLQFLVLIIATVACALGGWFLGASHQTTTPIASPAPLTSPAVANVQAPPGTESSDALANRLSAAVAEIRKIQSSTEQMVESARIIATLTSDQMPTALTAMDPTGSSSNRALLLEHWTAIDFDAAKAWVLALPDTARLRSIRGIAREWARRDPKGLMDWIKSQESNARKDAISSVGMDSLAIATANDPEQGLELIRKVRIPNVEDGQESQFYASLGKASPSDAAKRLLQLPAGSNRTESLVSITRQWAETDLPAAKKFWEGIQDAALSVALAPAILEGWSVQDPKAAIEFLADLPATKENLEAVPKVLSEWANRDPKAALAWLDRQPTGSLNYDAYGAVLGRLGDKDPEGALELLLKRDDAKLRTSYWGFTAPMFRLAQTDSESAAFARLEKLLLLEGSEFKDQLAAHYAGPLAQRYPDRVCTWAANLPPGGKRASILEQIALNLKTTDQTRAVQFAVSLPIDRESVPVIEEIAMQTVLHTPEKALPLYGRIAQPHEARAILKRHIYSWVHFNEMSARQKMTTWLQQTEVFSAEEKQALLTPPSRSK